MNLENINQRLNQMLPVGRLSHSKMLQNVLKNYVRFMDVTKKKLT